jgi:hypothetical protein
MSLLTIALFAAAVFAITVGFLIVYTRRVADVALTAQFRAGETIVNGRIPDRWVAQINRRITNRGVARLFRRDITGVELALDKIDKLYRFYENSPFFEDEKARDLLLEQLQETRERWAKMTWKELVSEQNGGTRPDIGAD